MAGSKKQPTTRPIEVLTNSEVKRLLGACSKRGLTGVRNRALIMVMWRAQLRVSEALDLKEKDLDHKSCSITVLRGKGRGGGKRRTVGMDETAWMAVETWLLKRQKCGANGRHHLFCTLKRRRMNRAYVDAMLKRLARKAGIEKRVHAHGLRHSGAAAMRRAGLDVMTICKQLGHESVATTHRYLDHIAPEDVVAAVCGMDWGDNE